MHVTLGECLVVAAKMYWLGHDPCNSHNNTMSVQLPARPGDRDHNVVPAVLIEPAAPSALGAPHMLGHALHPQYGVYGIHMQEVCNTPNM